MKKEKREALAYNTWNKVFISNDSDDKSNRQLTDVIIEISRLQCDYNWTKKLINRLNEELDI